MFVFNTTLDAVGVTVLFSVDDPDALNVITVPFTDKEPVLLKLGFVVLLVNCIFCAVTVSCASPVLSNIKVPPVVRLSVVVVCVTASMLCVLH